METIIGKGSGLGEACDYDSLINYKLDVIKQYQVKIKSISARLGRVVALCSISENKSRLQLLHKQLTFLYVKLDIAAADLQTLKTCPTVNEDTWREMSRIDLVLNDFSQFFRFTSNALQRLARQIRTSEKVRSILN